MERPIEPSMGPTLADVLLFTFESILMQGFLHFLHQVDSTEKIIREDNCYVPYFEDYVKTVVNVHISNTEIEVK